MKDEAPDFILNFAIEECNEVDAAKIITLLLDTGTFKDVELLKNLSQRCKNANKKLIVKSIDSYTS